MDNQNIKEILEALKPHNDNVKEYPLTLSIEQQKLLLDYITNLQEENERLIVREQECVDKYLNMSKYASEMEGKYILEKAKIDKAIEYIKKYAIYHNDAGEYYTAYFFAEEYDNLLNILEGDNKE